MKRRKCYKTSFSQSLIFVMCRILTTNSRNRKRMWRFHDESGKTFWKIEILTYLAFIFLSLYYVAFTVFQSYARIHV